MTSEEEQDAALRKARNKNIAGLVLILVGTAGLATVSLAAIGWLTLPLVAALAVVWVGWWLATRDASPGTAGTSPGTPGTGFAIDTDNLDPGAFIPGRDNLGPGEFHPPPPSRDESRDLDRVEYRDPRQ